MNSRRVSNFLCFIILGIVACSLLARYLLFTVFNVLDASFMHWFTDVAYWLTAIATLISAFSYAQSRRNALYMILLIVFLAIIVVFTFVLK